MKTARFVLPLVLMSLCIALLIVFLFTLREETTGLTDTEETNTEEVSGEKVNEETVVSEVSFTKLSQTNLDGPMLWLFAVDDGSEKLAVSAEQPGQGLLMGRWDPENPEAEVDWQLVAGPADTGGENIADHWHIFAHDRHWIVFSVSAAATSYLLQLDRDFNRLSLTKIADHDPVPEEVPENLQRPPDAPEDFGKYVVTNDMFMVAEEDGVAVGHFLPNWGHRIYRVKKDGMIWDTVDVGGGEYKHVNASSAIATDDGYAILGTEVLNAYQAGAIFWIETDENWQVKSKRTLIEEDSAPTSLMMASAVELPNGSLAVHVIARKSDVYPRGQRPPPPGEQEAKAKKGYETVRRYMISSDGEILDEENLVEYGFGTSRPHTLLVGDLLVTTWDMHGGIFAQVDRVSYE